MSLSAYKTWSANEVLSAADLNNSFLRILNNALTLISPLTGNLDFNGNAMIVDADGDLLLVESADDIAAFQVGATDLIKFDCSTASSVNGVTVSSAATGGDPAVAAFGSDTDVSLALTPQGAGTVKLNGAALTLDSDDDSHLVASADDVLSFRRSSTDLFKFDISAATPVNGLTFTAAAASSEPSIAAQGSDTDIDVHVVPKGAGTFSVFKSSTELFIVDLGTSTPVNGITITPSATSSDVIVKAHGSDSNIDIDIQPKGSGVVLLDSLPMPYLKTYASNSATADQSITASTETDITGLTGLTLPDTTSVDTKTFRVWARVLTKETGAAAALHTLRLYNGTNGTKADQEVFRCSQTVAASALGTILTLGPYEFTPGASKTKFGLSITMTQNGTVYGNSTATQNIATILVERVG
jgi:hypothetical protein